MTQPAFVERSRYYLGYEYPTKIRLAVSPLDEDAIWHRFNDSANSIGNLLLHLSGNIRQWIVCGVGGKESDRDRASEFAARSGPPRDELLDRLNSTVREADAVIGSLNESDLDRTVTIQGRETTVSGAVYHVVEHFAMHTGQIILLAKIHVPGQIKFYEDAGGIAIPLWGGSERIGRSTT
jgi:uncharacterized damage-inducible protein DinB